MSKRLKLTIAYDGTPFRGWQSQRTADSVQDVIEKALAKICKNPVRLHGSGRTDAGVHALGQIAHADVDRPLEILEWRRALNNWLPQEIRILNAQFVPETFHARFSAMGKEYRYEIYNGEVLPPHLFRTVWHNRWPFDADLLRKAMHAFIGTHDFAAFSAKRAVPVDDTHRTIEHIRVVIKGPLIRLTFIGDGFLYKMVRMLTAAAMQVACGKETFRGMSQRLSHPESAVNPPVAPAKGLTLVRVLY
ncbi:MAG: tRNA pseudouridine(38-40) synthase TruA [Chthoniobacterales bacterium]